MGIISKLQYLNRSIRLKSGTWVASISIILGGLAVVYGSPVATGPSGDASTIFTVVEIGWISIAFGTVHFLWGIRIHGLHIWTPWWKGKPSPFRVTAGINNFDYPQGSVAAGIKWQQGFSHVYLKIQNESTGAIQNIDAVIMPEHQIIHSSAHCDFANCVIAPLHALPHQVTFVTVFPDGQNVAVPLNWGDAENYATDPSHRLRCESLPTRAAIHIDIATVVVEEVPTSTRLWKKTRTDPNFLQIRVNWVEDGITYAVKQRLRLSGINHDLEC